jgi:hypothetical protein
LELRSGLPVTFAIGRSEVDTGNQHEEPQPRSIGACSPEPAATGNGREGKAYTLPALIVAMGMSTPNSQWTQALESRSEPSVDFSH